MDKIKETLSKNKDGVLINITVSPNAKKTEIIGIDEWRKRLIIKVKAPPVEGRANNEIIKYFKKLFGRNVEIVSGKTSSSKTVKVVDGDFEEVLKTLRDFFKK